MAYIETFVLYVPEIHSPFNSSPLWKSTLILILIAASGIVPIYAAYKMIQFSVYRLKAK